MSHIPTLFCPHCQTYLGPRSRNCSCGWVRPQHNSLLDPGLPLWNMRLPGAVHGAFIAGQMLIVHFGSPNGRGGVCAFDRMTGEQFWLVETPHSVEGGVVHFEENLYFATCGFLGDGAELYCLQLGSGDVRWKTAIGAGARTKPLVEEARLYIALEDGRIQGYDSRQGLPISHASIALPRGKVWLERVDQVLIALSKSGQVLCLNPQGLVPLWNKPYDVGCEITSAPCRAGRKLIFGGRDGQVIMLDVQAKKHSVLANGLGRVTAPPARSADTIFVGAHDHHLHAYDLKGGHELWKSEPFEHGISSAPFAQDGLVAVCINQSGIALLNAKTGGLVWHFPVDKDVKLLSDALLAEGVIYAGTDGGQVLALPWHLGKYEKAAVHLAAMKKKLEAAVFYATAANHIYSPVERDALYHQAAECWDELGESEWAARMWDGLAQEEKAAAAYCRAAESHRGRDNRLAAEFFYSASRLYWRLDLASQADTCAKQAAKLGRWPDIRLKERINPRMTQGKAGVISFRAENIGYSPARNLYFSLGGSLIRPEDCRVTAPLQKDSYFEISLEIVPTKAMDTLIVEAQYGSDESRPIPFSSQLSMTIEAAPPPHKIKAGDSVMGKLKIVNPNNEPIEVEIGDRVGTDVEIYLGEGTSDS